MQSHRPEPRALVGVYITHVLWVGNKNTHRMRAGVDLDERESIEVDTHHEHKTVERVWRHRGTDTKTAKT